MGRSLVFYKTEKGQCPVAEFLDSLPSKVAQKVAWVLKLLQELDMVPGQYFKKLTAPMRYGNAAWFSAETPIEYCASFTGARGSY